MPLIKRIRSQQAPQNPTSHVTLPTGEPLPPWLAQVAHQQAGVSQPTTPIASDDDFLNQLVWEETQVPQDPSTYKRRRSDHEAPLDPQAIYQDAYDTGYNKGYQDGHPQGYQAGFEEAKQNGYAEGMKDVEESSKAIWQILDQLDTIKSQVLEKSVQDIAPMAMAIAQRLIKVELSCDRALVVGIALDVLGKVDRTQKEVVFKVHPSDVKFLRQHIKEHEETWQGEVQRHIIVVGDAEVDLGSCIVETSGGQIDATFTTQLHMIRKILGLPNVAIASQSSAEAEFDHLLEGDATLQTWDAPAFDEH
jgi:flagellar assembly protein FliH